MAEIIFPDNPVVDQAFVDPAGIVWICVDATVGDVIWAREGTSIGDIDRFVLRNGSEPMLGSLTVAPDATGPAFVRVTPNAIADVPSFDLTDETGAVRGKLFMTGVDLAECGIQVLDPLGAVVGVLKLDTTGAPTTTVAQGGANENLTRRDFVLGQDAAVLVDANDFATAADLQVLADADAAAATRDTQVLLDADSAAAVLDVPIQADADQGIADALAAQGTADTAIANAAAAQGTADTAVSDAAAAQATANAAKPKADFSVSTSGTTLTIINVPVV